MGSIIHINKKPKTWFTLDEGKMLNDNYGNEPIIKIRYGSCDDDPDGFVYLEMYMRRNIYEKLVSGEYNISRIHHRELKIVDRSGNIIAPISDGVIY